AVQELAHHSKTSELMVARTAMALAEDASRVPDPDPRVIQHRSHVGYYLIGRGRKRLEKHIGYWPPFSKEISEGLLGWREGFYLGGIGLVTLAIVAFVLSGLGTTIPLITALLLLWLPAVDAAIGVMNQVVAFVLPPRPLPKLDFSEGIPSNCTTMVAVSTL